jgi:hypothetical protein
MLVVSCTRSQFKFLPESVSKDIHLASERQFVFVNSVQVNATTRGQKRKINRSEVVEPQME